MLSRAVSRETAFDHTCVFVWKSFTASLKNGKKYSNFKKLKIFRSCQRFERISEESWEPLEIRRKESRRKSERERVCVQLTSSLNIYLIEKHFQKTVSFDFNTAFCIHKHHITIKIKYFDWILIWIEVNICCYFIFHIKMKYTSVVCAFFLSIICCDEVKLFIQSVAIESNEY